MVQGVGTILLQLKSIEEVIAVNIGKDQGQLGNASRKFQQLFPIKDENDLMSFSDLFISDVKIEEELVCVMKMAYCIIKCLYNYYRYSQLFLSSF